MSLTLMNKEIKPVWEGGQGKYFKIVGFRLDEELSYKYQTQHVSQQIGRSRDPKIQICLLPIQLIQGPLVCIKFIQLY